MVEWDVELVEAWEVAWAAVLVLVVVLVAEWAAVLVEA